jgi:N-acylneuraminate cytidylyltransferase/CMP-N,N'-diacetyllegionaminic acid synthase
VLVSTDDPEIADVARTLGADAPFVRPDALARDDTPTMPVVIHALEWLEANESYSPNRVLLLQPTSPLRTSGDIAAAIALAEEQRAESIVSVSPASSHPHLIKRITPEGLLEDLLPHAQIDRRQDLEPVYALNGAIYLTLRSQLLKHQSFYPTRTHAYVMPAERSLDIDSPWDLELCDLILRHRIARD